MKKVLLLLLLSFPLICLAQKEQSIWFFGQNAGLDFSQGPYFLASGQIDKTPPLRLSGGSMTAKGGGATMADAFGNLLFYTDGVRVWNKEHQLMVNGTGLKGNPDATQTVTIVPKPLSRYKYYIFTTDSRNQNTPNMLRYSEVDMTLQGGLGEVVKKNIPMLSDVAEKITATLHANNQDFWLLAHTWNTNSFYAYKINHLGVSTTPVKTDIGSIYSGTLTTGRGSFRMNDFYDFNKTVVTLPDLQLFELLSFENDTGVFEGYVNLSSLYQKAAYADFSGFTRFYTVSVNGDEIYEFDSNGSNENITKSSMRLIARGAGYSDLRMAPNGLVYVSTKNSSVLHAIEYASSFDLPEYYGKPATFHANAVSLAPDKNLEGLPNTIANYSEKWWGWGQLGGTCLGEPITYVPNFPNSIDSILWNFDDPASGTANFSKELSPTHVFRTPGKRFFIRAVIYARGMVQQADLYFDGSYVFDLGTDTTLCFNQDQKLVLQPNVSGLTSYKWQDGSTSPTHTVTKPGIYWLEGTSATSNCTYRDSIQVNAYPRPIVALGNDTTMCTGKTLLLKAGNPGNAFLWQDGSSNNTFMVSNPGLYHVTVTNASGCIASDSIRVHYLTPPAIDLGNDTTLCAGTEIVLDATLPGVTYKWSDGSTGATLKVTRAGTYWVEGSIDICSARDYIVIKSREGCIDNLFIPNIITPNGDGLNDAFVILDPDKSNQWQLEIFNRHGKSIYKTGNYKHNWDASGLASGVYFYLAQDLKGRHMKGYLEVIR